MIVNRSFIPEAIAEKTSLEKRRADFDAEADTRFAKMRETGKTIDWADMRRYLEGLGATSSTSRPVAKKSKAVQLT